MPATVGRRRTPASDVPLPRGVCIHSAASRSGESVCMHAVGASERSVGGSGSAVAVQWQCIAST